MSARTPAQRRFADDVVTRGKPVEPIADGTLPQHATHVVERRPPPGDVEIKQVRYRAL